MNNKVVEIEERIPTLKERRKQRTNRRLIFYVSLFFILMTLITYFQTSISHIKTVEPVGNLYVPSEWIVEASGLLEEVSMWFYNESEVLDNLVSHPEIRSISIERQIPNTIVINVEEYERIAYIHSEGVFLPLLENGVTLDNIDSAVDAPFDAPILYGFDKEEPRKEFAEELVNVSESIRLAMSEIHLIPEDNDPLKLIIYMNDGFTVHSTTRRFSERIAPYTAVVEQLDSSIDGILHMRINPYFERFVIEEEEEGEGEG